MGKSSSPGYESLSPTLVVSVCDTFSVYYYNHIWLQFSFIKSTQYRGIFTLYVQGMPSTFLLLWLAVNGNNTYIYTYSIVTVHEYDHLMFVITQLLRKCSAWIRLYNVYEFVEPNFPKHCIFFLWKMGLFFKFMYLTVYV